MNQSDIAILRLISQQLISHTLNSPHELVSRLGAVQAQDYPVAKWALGVRLPGSTEAAVEAALDNGEIIRTHALRPTWHFVSPNDVSWIIDLSASQIKTSQRARDRQLELTPEVYSNSNRVIEKSLSKTTNCTREELIAALNQAGIATDQNRASHLFMRAELEKIMCSGAARRGKTTYALYSRRVVESKQLSREEALAKLARCYFTSRSPSTVQDFAWWSGLPARDANLALELVKSEFASETIEGRTYWLTPSVSIPRSIQDTAFLLPTYDELIISYTNRQASIPIALEQHMKQISDRGVFRPILVVNGQVVGIWKRTLTRDTVLLEIQPFRILSLTSHDMVLISAARYAEFLGKKLVLSV